MIEPKSAVFFHTTIIVIIIQLICCWFYFFCTIVTKNFTLVKSKELPVSVKVTFRTPMVPIATIFIMRNIDSKIDLFQQLVDKCFLSRISKILTFYFEVCGARDQSMHNCKVDLSQRVQRCTPLHRGSACRCRDEMHFFLWIISYHISLNYSVRAP